MARFIFIEPRQGSEGREGGGQEGSEKGGEAGGRKQFVVDRGEASWKLVGTRRKIREISAMIHVELVGTHPLYGLVILTLIVRDRDGRGNLETEIRNRSIQTTSGYYVFSSNLISLFILDIPISLLIVFLDFLEISRNTRVSFLLS